MRYLSVCSGIEAATVAWHGLGWTPVAFSEIEKFPRAVLKHHYPDVPLHGDFTTIGEDDYGPIDLLVGGTPCQSFSIAGLRGGLDDDRGNLALEFLRLAQRKRPEWLLWENVPGVLSSNGGRDFGSILGGMVELGYGFAYRVLDAQFFGVAQRRRRVFVVGHLGDWRRAAAVLSERQSLSGHPAPRRETGAGVAALTANDVGTCGADDNQAQASHLIAHPLLGKSNSSHDESQETYVAHTLKGEGFDASEDGTGRGTPIIAVHGTQDPDISEECAHPLGRNSGQENAIAIAFSAKDHGADAAVELSPTLRAGGADRSHANSGNWMAVAFQPRFARNGRGAPDTIASPLTAEAGRTGKGDSAQCIATDMAVRRLTPKECERLQGFPDDYTLIPDKTFRKLEAEELQYLRSRTHEQMASIFGVDPETFTGVTDDELCRLAKDGPRYKALGNSMAVPCMKWLGQRIQAVSLIGEKS